VTRRTTGLAKRAGEALRESPAPLDTAVLVFPLFLVYQLGIVSGVRNGADVVTALLMELVEHDLGSYLLLFGVLLLGYAGLLAALRRSGRFHPRSFLPLLAESGLYAVCMGSIILLVIRYVLWFVPVVAIEALPGRGPLEMLVIAAGAGLHEEFIFRAGLMGGLAFLLEQRMGRRGAWIVALVVSSLVFAGVHHLGSSGEDFTLLAFSYRTLAGAYFGVIYQLRGFAVAAWTHSLYDLYVLALV
jgi:membrane protease YdiL (CAAX protease family)